MTGSSAGEDDVEHRRFQRVQLLHGDPPIRQTVPHSGANHDRAIASVSITTSRACSRNVSSGIRLLDA
jgi:hypothetical protein